MDRLPQETLILVFLKLGTTNKLECLLVCKKWHDIISNSTELYKSLVFGPNRSSSPQRADRFMKAFTFFKSKEAKHFGYQVRSLELQHCWLDMFSFLFLPQLFPNLINFIWKDYPAYANTLNKNTVPRKEIYGPQFAQWIYLETLEISTYASYLPIMILVSSVFDRLTKLQLHFKNVSKNLSTGQSTTILIKPVFEYIANLAALNVLEVSDIGVDLEDMEKLHNCAPQLKDVSLDSIELLDTSSTLTIAGEGNALLKAGGEAIVRGIASKLKYISISLEASRGSNNVHISSRLARWIVYAGQNYPCLETLIVRPDDYMNNNYMGDRTLEDPLRKAVEHMPNLRVCQMGFSAVTSNILKAMDNNGTEVEDIELCVINEDDLINQLRSLKRSHQDQHISSLSIMCVEESFMGDVFRGPSTSLDQQYSKLVILYIHATFSSHTLLVDVLENVPPTLELIEFRSVWFEETVERRSESAINSRLKKLDLEVAWGEEETGTMDSN